MISHLTIHFISCQPVCQFVITDVFSFSAQFKLINICIVLACIILSFVHLSKSHVCILSLMLL